MWCGAPGAAGLDPSAVRLLLVGAEPIAPAGVAGLRPQDASGGGGPGGGPAGLSEATLAVTFPPPGVVARPLAPDRAALSLGEAVDAAPGDAAAVELMDVGSPVAGCAMRITDDAGADLGTGGSVTSWCAGPSWHAATTDCRR